MRFHFTTLGCPKNLVDSEMMAGLLEQAGHVMVDEPALADVLIVNTCAFIQPAREESYGVLGQLAVGKRRGQWLVAAGCLAQRCGGSLHRIVPGIDSVLGTRSWPLVVRLLEGLHRGESHKGSHDLVTQEGNLVASVRRRAAPGGSAYLKIADGCDAACAFCAIPSIKGPQRSKPVADVIREGRELAGEGVGEIVLIAQDTTAYGRDRREPDGLPRLLRTLALAVPEVEWLRIMYTYPQHVTPRLVEAMASLPQVCHYLDVPLQHGHPSVLRRMNRPHDLARVHRVVATLRQAMPDIALRTSFIVGYPGETEEEFETLLDFMGEMAFDKVGVFAYSLEEGTSAALLPDRIPPEVVAARYDRAMLAQQEISRRRNQEQVGRELSILVEGTADGVSIGRSYREAPEIDGFVLLTGEARVGQFVRARVVRAQEYDLIAELME